MRGNRILAVWAVGILCVTQANAQVNWIATEPADWNNDLNWATADGSNFVPDATFGDTATVNNGGTAQISGGVPDAVSLTIGNGTVQMSSGAALSLDTDLTNNGTLRIEGSNVQLNVGGRFETNGRLVAALSGTSHSPVNVTGGASLGGTLVVELGGSAPAIGTSWELVNSSNVTGNFTNVDTSLAPALPRGLQYQIETSSSGAALEVGNALVLTVDRTLGTGTIENILGDPIVIDGYVIRSENGLLSAGAWQSLAASGTGGEGWSAAPGSANRLVELNLTGSASLAAGEVVDVGAPYAGGFVRPGNEDLRFEYTTTDGQIRQGLVEFTGPENDIVLAVDPDTGDAVIRNLSPFSQVAANIDGYTITSASGSLTPFSWTGLLGSGAAGQDWRRGTGEETGLAELNLTSSTFFEEGTSVGIGQIFDPNGLRDLVFQYTAQGSANPPGDTNLDGVVNLVDFTALKDNFGGANSSLAQGDINGDGVVNLADFTILKDNFGAVGQAGDPGVFTGTVLYTSLADVDVAAVPEPSTAILAVLGLLAWGMSRRRRRNA